MHVMGNFMIEERPISSQVAAIRDGVAIPMVGSANSLPSRCIVCAKDCGKGSFLGPLVAVRNASFWPLSLNSYGPAGGCPANRKHESQTAQRPAFTGLVLLRSLEGWPCPDVQHALAQKNVR